MSGRAGPYFGWAEWGFAEDPSRVFSDEDVREATFDPRGWAPEEVDACAIARYFRENPDKRVVCMTCSCPRCAPRC